MSWMPMENVAPPFGVVLETTLTTEAFDKAAGGGGHFWLQEHGIISTTTLLPDRLATNLGFRISSYHWMEYESEAAMAFSGHITSGPTDLLDLVVYGMLVRPEVPGKLILGFIYREN